MYITCEQCSTIFRLDEKRLKPTGSKVRCCQCRNVFVAWPPTASETGPADIKDMEAATASFTAPAPDQRVEDTFDQELEGIDLAELDSILDQDRSEDLPASGDGQGDRSVASAAIETGELDESDLDLNFESELALDEEPPAGSAVDAGEESSGDLDLDMDFELGPEAASDAPESSAEDRLDTDDLEMDFELGEDLDTQADAREQDARTGMAGDATGEDIESVLDGFEDALSEAEGVEDEAATGSMEGEAEEDIDLSDLEDVLEPTDETGSAEEEVDLGDFETALEAHPDEGEMEEGDDFDIDLSDLDMDLDEEEETVAEQAAPDDDDTGLSLDDDFTLDEETAPPEVPADAGEAAPFDEQEVEEAFDLSDLDGLMDLDEEEEAVAEEAAPGGEDTELSLDDLTLDEEAAPSEVPADAGEAAPFDEQEVEEAFDLSDLDGLMDLDGEEEAAAEEAAPGGEDTGLSLDDLTLDEEVAPSEVPADAGEAAPSDDQEVEEAFDLSDLDGLMDLDGEEEAAAEEAAPGGEDTGLSLDEDLTLDLEEEPAAGAGTMDDAALPEDQEEDLDLSGLDGLDTMLEEDQQAEDSEPEDLELTLSDEPEDAGAEEETGDDEELDLTDLEKMLENETLVPDMSPKDQDSDLDLAGGEEKFTERDADSLGLDSGAELDLSEIEEAIDSAEEDTDSGGDEDQELELDLESSATEDQASEEAPDDDLELELEMESGDAAAEAETADDDQEAIDLSDLNLSLDAEESDVESEVIDAGDMELEFQIEDEMEPATIDSAETMPAGGTTASSAKTTVAAGGDASLIDEAFAEQSEADEEDEEPETKEKKKKKGSPVALIVVLILVLLGAGGYFGYQYVVKNNIRIPYLDDLVHPQPQDPSGTAMLTTLDINSKFIDNEKGGRIFVITGKVRNGYTVSCDKIQLQGKLYTKGKVLAKTEFAYAGVVVSDQDLAGQEVAQIKERLKTGGGQTAELVVNAGQSLPFMVVFSELPADLDEFAIELLRSAKAQ